MLTISAGFIGELYPLSVFIAISLEGSIFGRNVDLLTSSYNPSSMLVNGQFSDLTVLVGTNPPVPFRLHKLVMCANSGYFSKLFGKTSSGGFKENELATLTIPSEDPDVFERLVIYFYGNWPVSENILEATKLYTMSDYFDATEMKKAAMEDIIDKIDAAAVRLGKNSRHHYRGYDLDNSENSRLMKYTGVRVKITPEQRRTANIFGFHPEPTPPKAPTPEREPAPATNRKTTSSLYDLLKLQALDYGMYEDDEYYDGLDLDSDMDSYNHRRPKRAEKKAVVEQKREKVMEEVLSVFTSVCDLYHKEDEKLFEDFIKAFKSTNILKDIYKKESIRDFLKKNPELALKVVDVMVG